MQLSQKDIDEFKEIYRRQFGEDISDDEARQMGTRLLRFFKVLLEIGAQTES